MSQLTLPGASGWPRPTWRSRRFRPTAVAHTAWLLLRRTAVALARLLGWLAAEPARARAALGGLVLCVGLGAAIGLCVGTATARMTSWILGAIAVHQR